MSSSSRHSRENGDESDGGERSKRRHLDLDGDGDGEGQVSNQPTIINDRKKTNKV